MNNNKKGEIYSISKRKRKGLPDLPEGRSGAGVLSDDKLDYLFVFGGVLGDKYCSTVLRLNMKNLVIWESFSINEKANLLEIRHFSLLKCDKNRVLIIGGSKATN